MAALTRHIDDETFDADIYDPAYFPRKVVRDGKGLRVPVMLTDGMPHWMPPRRPLFEAAPSRDNARHHQPRYAVVDASDPHVRAAEAAYEARNKWLQDAWRTPTGGAGGAPVTTAPAADQPDDADANPPETPTSGGSARLGRRAMATAPALTTSSAFARAGFPPARNPAAVLAMRVFHEKRRTRRPIAMWPTPGISTGSSTGGASDRSRHPRPPA